MVRADGGHAPLSACQARSSTWHHSAVAPGEMSGVESTNRSSTRCGAPRHPLSFSLATVLPGVDLRSFPSALGQLGAIPTQVHIVYGQDYPGI